MKKGRKRLSSQARASSIEESSRSLSSSIRPSRLRIYNTEYRTVMDLTNKRYFFELTNQPNVMADLSKFDLKKSAPVMVLDPHDIELSGNVSKKFKKAVKALY